MTNQEMAMALGKYINGLLEKIAIYEGVFLEYRVPTDDGRRVELPWKQDAKRVAQEQSFRDISDAQSSSLQQAIGGDTPEYALIRALYRHFVGE